MLKNIEKINKITPYLLLAFLFFLPWQTRFRYVKAELNGSAWEYGSQSFYATEILLWVIIILAAVVLFRDKTIWARVKNREHFKKHLPLLAGLGAGIVFLGLQVAFSPLPWVSYQLLFWLLGGACLAVILIKLLNQTSVAAKSRRATAVLTARPLASIASPASQSQSSLGQLYFAFDAKRFRKNNAKYFIALWLGGVVQGLFALWQFVAQVVPANRWLGLAAHAPYQQIGESVIEISGERWLRAYGSLPHPNILGGYLAIIFIIGILLQIFTKDWRWRMALTLGQVLVLVGLLVTFSRGAWVAALGGLIICSAGIAKAKVLQDKKVRFNFIKQVVLSGVVVVAVAITLKPLFYTRFQNQERLEVRSIEERLDGYRVWRGIMENNWLLGHGPGMYTYALYQKDPTLPAWQYQPIHNTYLLIFAELGIVGFLAVLAGGVWAAYWIWKNNPVFLSLVAVVAISALFDHFWWSLYGGVIMLCVMVGLSTSKKLLY